MSKTAKGGSTKFNRISSERADLKPRGHGHGELLHLRDEVGSPLAAQHQRHTTLGLATMCIGMGQGVATVFERLK